MKQKVCLYDLSSSSSQKHSSNNIKEEELQMLYYNNWRRMMKLDWQMHTRRKLFNILCKQMRAKDHTSTLPSSQQGMMHLLDENDIYVDLEF